MSETKKNKTNPCADEEATKRFKLDEAPFSQMPNDDNEIPPTDDDDDEELASVDEHANDPTTEFFGLFKSMLGPHCLFGGLCIWTRALLLCAVGDWSAGELVDSVTWFVDANVLELEKGGARWRARFRCDGPLEWKKAEEGDEEPRHYGLLCPFDLFFSAGPSSIHYPVISWNGASLIKTELKMGLRASQFHRVDFDVSSSLMALTDRDGGVFKTHIRLGQVPAFVESRRAQLAPGFGILQSWDYFGDGGRYYWQDVLLRRAFGDHPRFAKFHAVVYETHANTLRLVRERDSKTCLVWRGVAFDKKPEFVEEEYTGQNDPAAHTWLGLFKGRLLVNEDSGVVQWCHVELIRDAGDLKAGETFARAVVDPLAGFLSLAKTTDARMHWKAALDITKDVDFAYDECPRNYYDEDEA